MAAKAQFLGAPGRKLRGARGWKIADIADIGKAKGKPYH
jgi:hypothetical protein